ncbi:MAG: tetratricopeptide repeat protein [Gemmatimonadota bacterium]
MAYKSKLRFMTLLGLTLGCILGRPAVSEAQEAEPDVVEALSASGADFAAQGEYPAAEALFRRALVIVETRHGANDTATASAIHSLAELLQVQGKEAEAEALLRRALAIHEQALPANHPDAGRSMSALGGLLRGLGQFEEAESLFERAANVFEVAVERGVEPATQIALLTELGDMYYSVQRYGQSEQVAARGLLILEGWKSSTDPLLADEAKVVHNLGALFFALDDLEHAETLHRRALVAREAALEPEDPEVLQSKNNLAVVLESQGKHEAADSLFQDVLVGLESSLGPDHPGAAIVSENFERNEDQIGWGRGGFEVNAHLGMLNDQPEFQPDDIGDQIRRDAIFGLRVGYNAPFNVFVQGEVANSLLRLKISEGGPGLQKNLNVFMARATVGYNLQPRRDLQLFVAAGPGLVRFDADGASSETNFMLHYGVGARYFLTPKNALRGDIRIHSIFDAIPTTRQLILPNPNSADMTLAEISVGVLHFFGGFSDSDRDGVDNKYDICPETLRGLRVGADGCGLDTDLDGVPDHLDMCRATLRGAIVNYAGCSEDTDQDGVPDGRDKCEQSVPGVLVDALGCAIPLPEVEECSCQDSIPVGPFHIDPEMETVELIPELIRAIDDRRPLVSDDVNFDFNQFTIREDSKSILRTVGEALVQRPDIEMEIQGHTDWVGSEAYNQGLSERRAQAVLDYLLETFPVLQGDQFTAVGMGELVPIQDNDTEEGRAANRRVEFVVSGAEE